MRSRYRVGDPCQATFVTSTFIEWLPVFTTQACCDILVHALTYCQASKGLKIYGWVILDNHFHAVLAAADLSRTMASIKRHTARRLLEHIESEGRRWLLNQFAYYRAPDKKESTHQVWQESFHPKVLLSDEAMIGALEYLHHNPVARGWVSRPEHWRYSSAHEWMPGAQPLLRCDRWR